MRLVSYRDRGHEGWGALVQGPKGLTVVDLVRLAPTLREAIATNALAACGPLQSSTLLLEQVTLLPPIPAPEKILCIGVNYANRNEEYRDGSEAPKYPSVFIRFPGTLTGHGQPLIRPPESAQLDYEGEIAVVIGRPGRRIARAEAWRHVAGLTLMNEGTIRDWLRHGKFNVTQGKNFDNSGSCGPWLVTADQFTPADYEHLRVVTRVNDEVRQDDSTANMMFPIAFLIEYLSTFCTLQPGDVIATGTPNGAGARFDPPRWLKPGDIVAVEVEQIGTLSNVVADEVL
jgi:2-keto-4-pentenoate hydratase/2-oxohepta-3-ene-1,7-dioic acid hydratase in catechol pathway